MDNKKGLFAFLIIVAVIVVLLLVIPAQQASDEEYIRGWAAENHHVVVKIERCWFSLGPYWFKDKNDRIYRLEAGNGRVFWFRRGLFRNDVEPGQ